MDSRFRLLRCGIYEAVLASVAARAEGKQLMNLGIFEGVLDVLSKVLEPNGPAVAASANSLRRLISAFISFYSLPLSF